VTKYHWLSIGIAVFFKRNDSIALELNKFFAFHPKIGSRLFLGLVLQAPNL
jgi:hypothetical protein